MERVILRKFSRVFAGRLRLIAIALSMIGAATPVHAADPRNPGVLACDAVGSKCPAWAARWDTPEGHFPESGDPFSAGQGHDTFRAADVSDEAIFVSGVSGSQAGDGILTQSYSLLDGSLRWSARYNNNDDTSRFAFPFDVKVSPDKRYVFVSGLQYKTVGIVQTNGLVVLSYDARTGELVWKKVIFPQDPQEGLYGESIAITSDRVYVATLSLHHNVSDTVIETLDRTNGALLWERRIANAGRPKSIAIDQNDDTVIVGSSHTVAKLDGSSGSIEWTLPTDVDVWASLVSFNTNKVILTGSSGTEAFDIRNGELLWKRIAKDHDGISVALDERDGRVFVSEVQCGCVVAFDAHGSQIWTTLADPDLGLGAYGTITLDPGSPILYLSAPGVTAESPSGFVTVAMNEDSGSRIWTSRYGSVGNGVANHLDVSVTQDRVVVVGTFLSNQCTPAVGFLAGVCVPDPGVLGGEDFSVIAYSR